MAKATGTDDDFMSDKKVVTKTRFKESDLLDNLLGLCGRGWKVVDDNGLEVECHPFSKAPNE